MAGRDGLTQLEREDHTLLRAHRANTAHLAQQRGVGAGARPRAEECEVHVGRWSHREGGSLAWGAELRRSADRAPPRFGCHLARRPRISLWLESRRCSIARMKQTFRPAVASAVLFAFALVIPSNEAQASEDLDVAKVLARPGVRLVAVEFYATWCEPCMKAMPRWKALKEKYSKQGLRVVVVNTLDPNAGCRSIGWVPDESVCDLEGTVSENFQLKGQLPAAFLWSWQGNLLVKAGHIDEVEKACLLRWRAR